ncbi:DUF6691 family protein [Vibrio sp. TRT 29B02]|uniref:DUF6691 family protein n=1 Tax=Vibrio sp. TRT 29B02 TaxID=3418508 RepID=UPI003CF3B34B
MNTLLFRLSALISGLLFGVGMALSGMIEPQKVIGFLDVAGQWDPSLAFVMGGALLIFMPCYFLVIKPRKASVTGCEYSLPRAKNVDSKLISGSALFGLGWGIAGICPGPAVASLGLGNLSIVIFFCAMVVGSLLAKVIFDKSNNQPSIVRSS